MRLPGTTQKRLYILGTKENRERALAECQNAVEYKMSGKGGSVSSWRDRGAARYDQSYTRRSRSRRYHTTPPLSTSPHFLGAYRERQCFRTLC